MRTLVFVSLLCCVTVASAEIYRWTDANGKQAYGDEPPENARAVEPVQLPMLTVAERFKSNPKPSEAQAATASSTASVEQESTTPLAAVSETNPAANDATAINGYERFSILVPKAGELVRSNSGELNIKLNIQPALKKGYGVVIYVDGRQVGETTTDSVDVTSIERGEHSVFAVLHDDQDNILGNTAAVNFTVARASRRF